MMMSHLNGIHNHTWALSNEYILFQSNTEWIGLKKNTQPKLELKQGTTIHNYLGDEWIIR